MIKRRSWAFKNFDRLVEAKAVRAGRQAREDEAFQQLVQRLFTHRTHVLKSALSSNYITPDHILLGEYIFVLQY